MNDKKKGNSKPTTEYEEKIKKYIMLSHTHFVHNLPLCPAALLLVCSHDHENIILLWHQVHLLWNSADTAPNVGNIL